MKNSTQKIMTFYGNLSSEKIKQGAVVLKPKINKFIALLKGPKILDAGCGPGHDTDYFAKKGLDCLGIDLSENMLEYARQHFQGRFKRLNLLNLNFKQKFDGIWCSAALMYVNKKNLLKVLSSFARALKADGVLGIIVPTKHQTDIIKRQQQGVFNTFAKKEIEDNLIVCDFTILTVEPFVFAKRQWLLTIATK